MSEEKKVFKTEDERLKALEGLPSDPPPGTTDIDEWQKQNEAEFTAIMEAPLSDASPTDNPPETPADPSLEAPPTNPPADLPPTTPPENDEVSRLNQRLQEQESGMFSMRSEYENKLKEQEETNKQNATQIEELKKKLEEAKKEAETAPPAIDTELQNLETELSNLANELENSNPDDDADYINKLKKQVILSNRVNQKHRVRSDAKLNSYKKTIEETKAEIAKRAEQEKKRLDEAVENQRQKDEQRIMLNEISDLRKNHSELQSDTPYEKMIEDYNSFSRNVAKEYFKKDIHKITQTEQDVAINAYLKKAPVLIENLASNGIKEPTSLQQYLLLSNVNALYKGYVQRGDEFVPYTNSSGKRVVFPSMKAAYEHYQNLQGKKGSDILAAKKETAQELAAAINQRTDPTQIDSQSASGRVDVNETPEEALKALAAVNDDGSLLFDDEKMAQMVRENPNHPLVKEYNKHLVALGQDTLTPESLDGVGSY